MARTIMISWLQPYSTVELEDRTSVPLLEELKDTKDGKVVMDYEPEELEPNGETVTQEEKKEDFNADYVNMELLNVGMHKQRAIIYPEK